LIKLVDTGIEPRLVDLAGQGLQVRGAGIGMQRDKVRITLIMALLQGLDAARK
jgi:hypothetical protein